MGRPGLLRLDPKRLLRRRFRPEVWAREMDKIGAWIEGRTPRAVSEERRRYVAGQTEPGDVVNTHRDIQ